MRLRWGCLVAVCCVGWLVMVGCETSGVRQPEVVGPQMSPADLEALRNAPLRLLLVGDAAWGEEIQIQFQARGTTPLETLVIDETQWYGLSPEEIAKYDVVICPPDRIAELAVGGHLLKLSPAQLEKWDHADWLPIDRRLARLDQEVYGISLGGPLWSVIYQPDRWRAADEPEGDSPVVPTTWSQWQAAVQRDREQGLNLQWLEPLSDFGAAEAVLMRAASLAKGPAQTDVFLSRIDGQPRLTTPPFLRALEDLKATYGDDLRMLREITVAEAIRRVSTGQAKVALVPLPRQDDVNAGVAQFVPGPPLGSDRFYNYFDQAWSIRAGGESLAPQLVGTAGLAAGRAVGVLRKTRKSEAAGRLIDLLVASPTAESFATYHGTVRPFRRQHLTNLSHWAGRQYAAESIASIQQIIALAGDEVKGGAAVFPPMPGNRDRLAALNAAVWRVLDGEQDPAAALGECQQVWLEISARYGVEVQKTILNRNR